MIIDTGVLYAAFSRRDPDHAHVTAILSAHRGRLIVSPLVLAELDYFVLDRLGSHVEQQVLEELTSAPWEIAPVGQDEARQALGIIRKFKDLNIGLTDAMNLVLAERDRYPIATLDRRHFNALRFSDGSAPTILP